MIRGRPRLRRDLDLPRPAGGRGRRRLRRLARRRSAGRRRTHATSPGETGRRDARTAARRRLRRLTLTVHIATTVGWLGAVVVFLALAIIGLTTRDGQTARAAYLVMEPMAWFVLVPLALASLVSGIVLSLSTTWGLVEHYWVAVKLGITVVATAGLLLYTETVAVMSAAAADPHLDLSAVRHASPVLHTGVALLLLVVATALSVYKPRGMTPYGRRRRVAAAGAERRRERGISRLADVGLALPGRAAVAARPSGVLRRRGR